MSDLNRAEEITEALRDEIQTGKIAAGDRLPSERDLAKQFDVSRETLRRALQNLEGEELISRKGTLGTFVKSGAPRIEVIQGQEMFPTYPQEEIITSDELAKVGSFIANMKKSGRQPRVTFLDPVSLVAANDEVAHHLQVAPRSLVLRRYRLQSADGTPYRIIESFYPGDFFAELLQTDIGETPLFQWLTERHNKQVQHVAEDLTGRLPAPIERQLLKISPSSPVIAFDRTVWELENRVIEWAHIIAVAALYRFHYEYDINWEKEPAK